MPNKKVELILMFTTKKIFFKRNTFFQKIALNQLRQAKITQTLWEKGSSKRHIKADACISTKVLSKKNQATQNLL